MVLDTQSVHAAVGVPAATTGLDPANAILHQGRTGCQWAYPPHDLPQKSATYYYFAAWRDDGTGFSDRRTRSLTWQRRSSWMTRTISGMSYAP